MFLLRLSVPLCKAVHALLIASMITASAGPVLDLLFGHTITQSAYAQSPINSKLPQLQVIVQAANATSVLTDTVVSYGGTVIGSLDLIDAVVATIPASQIHALEADTRTSDVTIDAPMHGRTNFVTAPLQAVSQLSANEESLENTTAEAGEVPLETVIPEAGNSANVIAVNPNSSTSAYSLFLPTMLTSGNVSAVDGVAPDSDEPLQPAAPDNLRADDVQSTTAVATPEPTDETEGALSSATLTVEQFAPVVTIYDDSLHQEWTVVPWAQVDLASTDVATVEQITEEKDGNEESSESSVVMSVEFNNGWDGLYLDHANPLALSQYDKLSFWLHGGSSGNQQIWIKAASSADQEWGASDIVIMAKANQWTYYEIALEDITQQEAISGFLWQNMQNGSQSTFYLDNIRLGKRNTALNQVNAASANRNGLNYSVYHGKWYTLPNFDSKVPAYSGTVENFEIDVRDRNYYFGIAYDGYIYISQSDWYRFYTNSDDGSKLYINDQKVVDNDGIHGWQERAGWINLEAGYHRIEVDFFESTGSQGLEVGYQSQTMSKQTIPSNMLFQADPTADPNRGTILREWWTDVDGESISILEAHHNYPHHPTGTDYPTVFNGKQNWENQYGLRMRGYVHPPISGWYKFAIAGNNQHRLWLSNDENAEQADMVAYGNEWVDYKNWNRFSSQTSSSKYLEAGRKYYIESLVKEGFGHDHLTVAWQVPGGEMEVIDGFYLSPFEVEEESQTVDPLGYNRALNINGIHNKGITGDSVTVGFMDTGIDRTILERGIDTFIEYASHYYSSSYDRYSYYNSGSSSTSLDDSSSNANEHDEDSNGHGTFMAEIAHSQHQHNGQYIGVAPDSEMYSWAVLDADGKGTYSTIIDSLELAQKVNIDVVNMSLQGPVVGPYWENPLNQAVEALWESGTVVVAAAGNTGPDAGSITTPGNDPFVITVGAYTDNYTPDDPFDDFITPFSAAGPTEVGFIKPDIVAPGGHLVANLPASSRLAGTLDRTRDGLYVGAGTSAATAYVSGVVALMLEENRSLTPDEVKYRLIASAQPIINSESGHAKTFSLFQQGAGRIDPYEAVFGDYDGRANQGMVPGSSYVGPASYDAERDGFVLLDEEGNRMPQGSDYFWGGDWAYSGSWAYSGGWAYSSDWVYAGNWAYSSEWVYAGGWYFVGTYDGDDAGDAAAGDDDAGRSSLSEYWSSNKYWDGDHYWSGSDFWTGIFQDKN